MKRFKRFLMCTAIAFLIDIAASIAMAVGVAFWHSGNLVFVRVLDYTMLLALFPLISIIPFFALEETRLEGWRHIFFLLPWTLSAFFFIPALISLANREHHDGWELLMQIAFINIFTIYSAGFWASAIYCFIVSHLRSKQFPKSVLRSMLPTKKID